MSLKIDASFENGVFVPAQMPTLADQARVRLTVEQVHSAPAQRQVIGPVEDWRPIGARSNCILVIALDFHPDGC
jgi:hypothetical protein